MIFVDYDNLFSCLHGRTGSRSHPVDVISELLHGVRQHISRKVRATASMMAAYADFEEIPGGAQDIKNSLYMQGVEPRFVPGTMQENAAELQLTVDVVESLYTHPDVRVVVIVTGDRPYLPLIQHSLRSQRRPMIFMLRPPDTDRRSGSDHVILDASRLLRDSVSREFGGHSPVLGAQPPQSARPVHDTRPAYQRPQEHRPSGRMDPSKHREVTHPGALAALEVIEEHFGQYDEIYLTPLLRKLSEVVGDQEYDPKALISVIEQSGAAWLEKRKGFPYDYTVLLTDSAHPTVAAIQLRVHGPGFAESPEGVEMADTSANLPPRYVDVGRPDEEEVLPPQHEDMGHPDDEVDLPPRYEEEDTTRGYGRLNQTSGAAEEPYPGEETLVQEDTYFRDVDSYEGTEDTARPLR